MLENLGKTVIVTGSQIPIFEIRSDGRDNFLGALIVAGTYCIPEVCVFFNHKLYRGNRTVKRSNGSLDAFDSPNLLPLAQFGIDVHGKSFLLYQCLVRNICIYIVFLFIVDYRSVFRPVSIDRFRVHSILNRNVCLLRLFPSITIQTVRALLHPPIEGIVMQTYGSGMPIFLFHLVSMFVFINCENILLGNVPSNRLDLIEELRAATHKGVLIINTTQCCHGLRPPSIPPFFVFVF